MANFVIAGDTSGTVTLQAPAVSGTTTLTLPTTSGTVLTTAASQTLTTPNIVGPLTLTSGGITFNANPGGGTQATLNDYETGTWTPVLVPGTGTITSSTVYGSYTKVGKLVTLNFQAQITGGTVTSMGSITGLPFTCSSTAPAVGCAREFINTGLLWSVNISSGGTGVTLFTYANGQTVTNTYAWAGSISYVTAS